MKWFMNIIFGYIIRYKYIYYLEENRMNKEDINLYDVFSKYSYKDIMKLFQDSKTNEERDFYANLSNYILQKEQMKVIGK